MNVEFLVLPNGKCPVEEFLDGLDDKTLAKIYRLIDFLKLHGSLPFPHARKMGGSGNLWELRISSRGKAVRVFYVYRERNKIVLVSGFIKKSQKTPKRELDRAVQYLKDAGVKL